MQIRQSVFWVGNLINDFMTDFQSEVQERRLFITYSFFKASIASSICASTSDYLIIIPNVLEDFENVSNVFQGFDPHDSSSQGSCQMYLGGGGLIPTIPPPREDV